MWRVPPASAAQAAGRPDTELPAHVDRGWLRNRHFIDGSSGQEPVMPAHLRQQRQGGEQFWMLQLIGPVKEEWLAQLNAMGLQTVIYMPSNAYAVWGNASALRTLEAQSKSSAFIQWTGAYHPAYRLAPRFSATSGKGSNTLPEWVDATVPLYLTANASKTLRDLAALRSRLHKKPEDVLLLNTVLSPIVQVNKRSDYLRLPV